MNKAFKIIWNAALNRFDVVCEITKAGKKCKASSSSVNSMIRVPLVLGLGSFIAGTVGAAPLPPIVINSAVSESNVERDSATGPAVAVVSGGDYTGTNVIITSQAPASGGNTAALYVNSGGQAHLDAGSSVTMNSSTPATTCCSYGIVVDGAGSVVDSSATVIGSTGGAGAYGGGQLNLNGGSMSGLFGIVSSGTGSLITGTADISGSGAGTGVRAELGGSVVLNGGNVLSNGMTATGSGSSISATGLTVNGRVNANNGSTITLDGGSVTAGGFGAIGVYADGSATSHITTSANITMTGGGGGGGAAAVSARNGATVDVIGGNLVGDSFGLTAVSGGKVSVSNANITSNSTGIYAADSGSRVTLNSGTVSMPGWNNVGVTVESGAVVENLGVTIIGGGSSSIGAQANNGGSFILGSGVTMTGSGTGVKANGTGSSVVSSGNISATQRAVYATSNGLVTINGGSLATTVDGSTGIVAESGGQVSIANAPLLDTAIFAGNGIQVTSGGIVNLAGGTLNIGASNSSGLIIDGAGSTITSSSPLGVNVSGSSSKAISVSNGASQTFQNLAASVTGSNGNVIQSGAGVNQLTFTDSTLSSVQGAAILGQGGTLNLVASNTQISGPVLVQDSGSIVNITASNASVMSGTAVAGNSSITLNTNSLWNVGVGNSALATFSLDDATMRNMGAVNLSIGGDVTLGSGGGTFDTNGFDTVLTASTITGTGNLTKNGTGKMTVDGGINYTGNTTISNGTLQIGNGVATGNVHLYQVDNSGILAFNRPDLVTVDAIDGSGAVEQNGSGTTLLLGNNTYAGTTTVAAGTLALDDAGALMGTGDITVMNGATFGGFGQSSGNITNDGVIAVGNALDLFNSRAVGNFTSSGSLINNNTIQLGGSNGVGNTLTVVQNYTGNDGYLNINTVLGDDSSLTDRLIVGNNTSGNTTVLVNNIGGAGAKTLADGIEIVSVGGASNGTFQLGHRVTAGLYEYDLYQGGVGTNASNGNWYLRTLEEPVDPVTPVINPESTVYLRNLNAASTMFMHTLHDRLGEPQFTAPYKTGSNNPSSAWVRVVSNHTNSTGGNGQVDLNTDTNLVHLGTDIARWSNDGNDRWILGVMGAYGKSKIDASAKQMVITPSGFKRNATGEVDGYSVGGYATWYQNQDKPEGIYVDAWAQYGWFDNKVQGNTQREESYNSNGWTASVEAGYAMVARDEGNNRQLMFEPQVQVAYNSYNSDDHTDGNGTRISDNNANGVITRVGARLYGRSTQNDNGIQPFVEANWWYSDAKNSLSFNGETMSDGTPNSRYELKAGLQGEIAKNWLMWGHAGVQFGENDFNRYEGMVGIKRMF